ncbi:MAG: hypothetical protein WCJ09_24375 [Planctomycetota bacterium]
MDDPVITVEQFEFLPDAEAIRMRLESDGIDVFLADKETVSTDWALGNAIGYIKLQVRQSQAEAARAVIEEIRELRKARKDDTTNRCLACNAVIPASTVCPQCGWTYESDDAESNDSLSGNQNSSDADEAASPGLMEALRGIKKPMVTIVLAPAIAGIVLGALVCIFTIFTSLLR